MVNSHALQKIPSKIIFALQSCKYIVNFLEIAIWRSNILIWNTVTVVSTPWRYESIYLHDLFIKDQKHFVSFLKNYDTFISQFPWLLWLYCGIDVLDKSYVNIMFMYQSKVISCHCNLFFEIRRCKQVPTRIIIF